MTVHPRPPGRPINALSFITCCFLCRQEKLTGNSEKTLPDMTAFFCCILMFKIIWATIYWYKESHWVMWGLTYNGFRKMNDGLFFHTNVRLGFCTNNYNICLYLYWARFLLNSVYNRFLIMVRELGLCTHIFL